MDPNVPPTTATRKRRWGIAAGLMSLATAVLLLWMLWPAGLNDVEKQLVGTWTPRANPGAVFITFHSDRTVAHETIKTKATSAGQWWADSDTVYWDTGFKDVMNLRIRRILHGGLDHNKHTLLSVDKECFRFLVPVNGKTYEFIRVPNSSVAPLQD